ncbi:MAG TPA: hypothetical protein ENJ77_00945 [Candidatus Moranbacteria bacterium]|nr:hypothetical protein [Candidatus Moranbacteria bacterium]
MHLRKIEIIGFKSFANKTALTFTRADGSHAAVTAVVGPNGSGKSNVSDALRWVMGEQSMKGLRAGKGRDIIFAGSTGKSRLNSATVTLYLDNPRREADMDFAQISLSRTVYRDGSGEYRLNDAKVRLADITDLLAKVGMGKGSFAVINQGMTDAFLTASPTELRSVIEDAAGVKVYRLRRNRALRKLARTIENLRKVDALLAELEPQLRVLKRQADRAAAAEEVAEEFRRKQKILYAHRCRLFQRRQAEDLRRREEIDKSVREKEAQVNALAEEISARAAEAVAGGGDREEKSLEQKTELEKRLRALAEEEALCRGRLELEKEKLAEEIAALKTRQPVNGAYVRKVLEKIISFLEKETAESGRDFSARALIDRLKKELIELCENVKQGTVKVDISARREELTRRCEERSARWRRRLEALRPEREKLLAELSRIDKFLLSRAAEERKEREKFFAQEEKLRRARAELDELRRRQSEIAVALARTQVREEDLAAAIREDLDLSLEELRADPLWDHPVEDEEKLAREVARLRAKHEAAGALDPLVIEEYRQTQERYDFLSGEARDLRLAEADLRRVAAEMEKKITAAFERTFGQINKLFDHYFRTVFGGGRARLKKIDLASEKDAADEESGAEAAEEASEETESDSRRPEKETSVGIVISVKPPGKKAIGLDMLSGGERSLVSLAFLFALIAHNPPPFVLLDEVEAALDEANARRFGLILRELSEKTQFVVITHNRETMRAAELLYGVTMGPDGASRLLSVRPENVAADGKIKEKV